MSRPRRLRPQDYVVTGSWPGGRVVDPVAKVSQEFARRLASAIEGQSLREVEATTGVDHVTLIAILEGRSWPDLMTISRLQIGLDTELMPPHRSARARRPAS